MYMGSHSRGAQLERQISSHLIFRGESVLACWFWIKHLIRFVQTHTILAGILHQMIQTHIHMMMGSLRGQYIWPPFRMMLIVVPPGRIWIVLFCLKPLMRVIWTSCSRVFLLMRHMFHIQTETFLFNFFNGLYDFCCCLMQRQCLRYIMQILGSDW